MRTNREHGAGSAGHLPTSYAECERMKLGRLTNNTTLRRTDEGYAITLHATDVVTFLPAGTIRLDTGGYHTRTTLDRINRVITAHGYRLNGSTQSGWTGKRPARFRAMMLETPAGTFPYVDGAIVLPSFSEES